MREQESRKAVDEVNELIEFWAEELDVVEEWYFISDLYISF